MGDSVSVLAGRTTEGLSAAIVEQLTGDVGVSHVFPQVEQRVQQRPRRRYGRVVAFVVLVEPPRGDARPPRLERTGGVQERQALGAYRLRGSPERVGVIDDHSELGGTIPMRQVCAGGEAQPRSCAVQGVRDDHGQAVGVFARRSSVQLVGGAASERSMELIEGLRQELACPRDRRVGHVQLISIIFSRTA
jgi:hypothetical protein